MRLMHPDHKFAWEDSLVDTNDLESVLAQQEEVGMQRAMLPVALGTLDQRQRHILIERRLKERPAKLESWQATMEFPQNGCVRSRIERLRNYVKRCWCRSRKQERMSTVDMAPGVRSYEAGYGCQARCRDRTAQLIRRSRSLILL